MSGGEILLILVAVLVLFGADKMPGIARSIGRGMREFQKAADEIKSELADSTSDIRSEMNNIRSDIQDNVSQTRQTIAETKNEFTSAVSDDTVNVHAGKPDDSYKMYEEAEKNNATPTETHATTEKGTKNSDDKFMDIGANI